MIQFRNCTSLRIHYSRCGKWPANKRLEKKNLPVFTFVNAYTWSLELKATIFKATQEEIQQQVDEKVQIITLKVLCESFIQRLCSYKVY